MFWTAFRHVLLLEEKLRETKEAADCCLTRGVYESEVSGTGCVPIAKPAMSLVYSKVINFN